MKAADLNKALFLIEWRKGDAAMRDRLANGAPLTLLVGEGAEAGAVFLVPAYVDEIRVEVVHALDRRIAKHDADLAACGVEP